MINVEICSGSKCMMAGASTMFDVIESLVDDLKEQGYEAEVNLGFSKCMQYCRQDPNLTPVVKINDEVVTKATTQGVMEMIVEMAKK
ncbi:MAG: (2Fe-2S) ferredoxin domain-containing protein [Peptostreptococcaceae bacterium]|nr:(2Fe-2S) ferredoxin domain-containing protein [Peptostreptococcaceae bacterium]